MTSSPKQSLGNGDSSLQKSRGWHLLGPHKGQKGVLKKVNFKKSSSHELAVQIL